MDSHTYPKGPANSVNRYKDRATYDAPTIHSLINSTPVLHVSFVPDPTTPVPAILPMIGKMGLYPPNADLDDGAESCYLHGYVTSRLMKLATTSHSPDGDPGLPVAVAATKVDGLVLSLTPNSHSYNYRSAVLHGVATLVEDVDEKLWAMELITDAVVPERWKNTRVPPDGAEMQSTRILKVRVTGASGKVREGGPNDERKDMKREDVLDSVWTGVVPRWEVLGEPVGSSYNRVEKVPEYLGSFVQEENERREREAKDAAVKQAPQKKSKKTEED
ncbi:hypothetical protein H2201_002663 [Coniosporium apollinis]|uniref:Flavin-nucleotide-binding protein n=1 Tax=Coniosporium apollinis TaxID=61459 RepID=A0ABQ9NZH9_9PEZI|nr:hypothetical protein H2201_002663 [Coniosporium apollinis]